MRALTPAIGIGLLLLALWIGPAMYLRRKQRKKDQQLRSEGQHAVADAQAVEHTFVARLHQRIVGLGIIFYGIYLSTLVGTMTRFVLPGAGAVGGGAAAGAGVGLLTYLVIGTVGVVTGGTGIALGALAMSLIGGGLGAAGAAVGVAGFRALSYPLVSPFFWGPVIGLGIYLIVGIDIKKKLTTKPST